MRKRKYRGSLDIYAEEAYKIPLLKPDEEKALGYAIRRGDQSALNKLIRSNLRMVFGIADRYRDLGYDYADLVSEGNIGLIRAAKRFDPTRGNRFASYAVWWIRQSIRLAISYHAGTIRIPSNHTNVAYQINKAMEEAQVLVPGWRVEMKAAEILGISLEDLQLMRKRSKQPTSLDQAAYSEDSHSRTGTMLTEIIPDKDAPVVEKDAFDSALRDDIRKGLSVLTNSERDVIKCRFGLDENAVATFKEIGTFQGRTKQRIEQIEKRAIRKLRVNPRVRRYLQDWVA